MIKQNPFSLYDFLGYLIPGALATYLIIFLTKLESISTVNDFINIIVIDEKFQLDKILFFIILSYCFGHLISYFSSITVELYSVMKYDYPSKYLIGFNKEQKYFQKDYSWKRKLFRILLATILLPLTFLDFCLGEYFNFKLFYTKPLDNFLVKIIKDKSLELMNILYPIGYKNISNYDFHRIISHYVYENSKNHQSKMSNYVALYGFLRSITLIFNFLFWICLYINISSIITFFDQAKKLNIKILFSSIDFTTIIITVSIAVVTYVYFMAFMKFYRRYTLEAFMLVAIDKDIVLLQKPISNPV